MTHFPPPPNTHLWSYTSWYAPEGVCGDEIHYFRFCLLLLFAAQQLKGSDQPTITIHNGFSASSTSLEACLRSGLSPCATPLPILPARPGSSLHHPWCLWACVHMQVDVWGLCFCVWEFTATAVAMTAEDPIENEWSQPVRPGAPEFVWSCNNRGAPGPGVINSLVRMKVVTKKLCSTYYWMYNTAQQHVGIWSNCHRWLLLCLLEMCFGIFTWFEKIV